jgi:hypothetical protein
MKTYWNSSKTQVGIVALISLFFICLPLVSATVKNPSSIALWISTLIAFVAMVTVAVLAVIITKKTDEINYKLHINNHTKEISVDDANVDKGELQSLSVGDNTYSLVKPQGYTFKKWQEIGDVILYIISFENCNKDLMVVFEKRAFSAYHQVRVYSH